jgi:thioredoxin 1
LRQWIGKENVLMAKPIHVKSEEFKAEVLEASDPVVVDFWAEWCGPCRLMTPVIDQLAEEYDGRVRFIEVNVDENPDVAMDYGIEGIPTLVLFHQGKVIDRIVGYLPKPVLIRQLEAALPIAA